MPSNIALYIRSKKPVVLGVSVALALLIGTGLWMSQSINQFLYGGFAFDWIPEATSTAEEQKLMQYVSRTEAKSFPLQRTVVWLKPSICSDTSALQAFTDAAERNPYKTEVRIEGGLLCPSIQLK